MKTASKLAIFSAILMISFSSANAQFDHSKRHSWWFGAATGSNFNIYTGSTQELNSLILSPVAFHKGNDAGMYFAPMIAFHRPKSSWGFMLQAGYDSRKGTYNEEETPCDCAVDLEANLSYLSVEPSVIIAPFNSKNFHLYMGPRVAFNINKSFSFTEVSSSDVLTNNAPFEIVGDFSKVRKTVFSMQVGISYDIPLVGSRKPTQSILSPFISFHPYFGQMPRIIETWDITTIRVGASLKFSPYTFGTTSRSRYKRK